MDKSDSARWLFGQLRRGGVGPGLVLLVGDEFGTLGGLAGSDSFLLVPEAARATAVSFGAEPTGTPAGVLALGGGPDAFLRVLADQVERRPRRCGRGCRACERSARADGGSIFVRECCERKGR